MKKLLVIVLTLALLIAASTVALAKDTPANDKAQSGKSNIGHLYLYEKVPTGEWPIVDGGAWGKLKHNLSGSELDVVFNGHGLVAGQAYSLITYVDPWPGTVEVFGTATANGEGNVHIKGSANPGDTTLKVWLVLAGDVGSGVMTGWNPADYLFEHNLITFDDTDVA